MLDIRTSDVQRATLPLGSGNEGWIGFSPDGNRYHVVVPVDAQIARGVMACNCPDDGTPFGGYAGWLYFRCEPFQDDPAIQAQARTTRVLQNGQNLLKWLASYHIRAELVDDAQGASDEDALTVSFSLRNDERSGDASRIRVPGVHRNGRDGIESSVQDPETLTQGPAVSYPARHTYEQGRRHKRDTGVRCTTCGKTWKRLGQFVSDPHVELQAYRACAGDFRRGKYIFAHGCHGLLEVPVTRFASPRPGRSLIGSHGCPGLCHYETPSRTCFARCEGACYRRIAGRLSKKTDRKQP